jgi:hypothetical protein
MHKRPSNFVAHGQQNQVYCNLDFCIAMQTFVGCEMYNKIDPFFSLCIVGKGAKEWK